MKIIKNAIVRILRWAAQNESSDKMGSEPVPMSKSLYSTAIGSNRHGPDMQGMNFTIFNAIGGKVVQFNQYDPNTDRNKQQLYIITDKDDLGAEISQIITVESLSR